ncbi:MAG TPA: helix-turn-helix domain-containing protein, partial [Pseudonocardiaceae bacterium]
AQQTRRLIREAAADLFVRHGIAATTMRQVAAAAGVAERTVYTAFPTKTALFHEVIDIATVGDELPIPVAERAEFTSTLTEFDPVRAARQTVDYGCALLERSGALIMAAIESSGADPDMREFAARGGAMTSANLLTVAQAWERNGLLRDGVDAERARAILYTLSSPHVHQLLRRDQGWDLDRYRDWLVDMITNTVLREP